MGIDPKRYKKRRKKKNHAVHINIRMLRDPRYGKPTLAEARAALRYVLNYSTVPEGWRFAYVDWRRPAWQDAKEGELVDVDRFRGIIEDQLYRMRVSLVRRGDVEELR